MPFNIMKTFKKFQLVMKTKKMEFVNDYDYVDHALYVLGYKFTTPLEAFKNDLEGNNGETKSTSEAENYRSIGNDLFRAKVFFEALKFYTLSVSYAETGSDELALAYGNRSAVLFEKQYYKECLEDIERALENNYPREKRDKLLSRQTKAKKLLPTQKKVLFHEEAPVMKNKTPKIPATSQCIRVNRNKEHGRHIVANRNINPGEILLIEKPYAQFVFPEHRTLHCSECLELCYNLIPCERCSGVLYCSKACRRKAYIEYHRYECAILKHFGYDAINFNCTRMTLKAIQEYDTKYTDTDTYRSDRYKEVSELTVYKNSLDFIIIMRMIGAAKAFYALKKHTDILSVLDIENKENVLKSWLMKDSLIDQCNAYNVLVNADGCYEYFGRGIYSTLSMFNHACNENVGHSFFGSTVVVRATKEIKEGEQCFINYGAYPCDDPTRVRQRFIQEQYRFTCRCQACVENWSVDPISMPTSLNSFMSQMAPIYSEVVHGPNIEKSRKKALLRKSIEIFKKTDKTLPIWTYEIRKKIFLRIMLEGNKYIPF